MRKMKEKKGITLVTLVITVIIMLILTGITIYLGVDEIEQARERQLLTEVEMVSHAVYEAYVGYQKTKNETYLVGEIISKEVANILANEMGVILVSIPSDYAEVEKAYYRLTPADLEKIGIQKSEDNYIVNYASGEVMNETQKMTQSGKALYTCLRSDFSNRDVTAF